VCDKKIYVSIFTQNQKTVKILGCMKHIGENGAWKKKRKKGRYLAHEWYGAE
jgi:hypothetical protein